MIILALTLLGLCLGSFVNALNWRIHEQSKMQNAGTNKKSKAQAADLSIVTGRSMCSYCKYPLAAKDLIPVISWLSLRGKCRYCHKPIQDTPFAEIITPLLFIASFAFWPIAFNTLGKLLFGFWLVFLVGFMALALYDLRWRLLPNRIVYPLIVLAVLQVIVSMLVTDNKWRVLTEAFLGFLVGGGIFWLLFQMSGGKWIGGGDVKLGWLLGLIVGGPVASFLMIFLASLLGTIISVPLLVTHKTNAKGHIPFGPFLIASAIIVRLLGASLIIWYKHQAGLA